MSFVRSDIVARWVVAATALLAGLYMIVHHSADLHLQRAEDHLLRGQLTAAIDEASHAMTSPSETGALVVQAHALAAFHRDAEALVLYRRAELRDPNNWQIHRDWAVSLRAVGDLVHARRQMRRALRLNPLMQLPTGFVF